MFYHRLISTVVAVLVFATTVDPVMAAPQYAKSIAIHGSILAGNANADIEEYYPHYVVEETDGKYVVVVKIWNETQNSMVTTSNVTLDENNQFIASGLPWKFTLLPSGYLTWEEVKK